MKKIYILLFICSQAFTQTIHLKGRLADSNTKEPVIYANISFLESNVGVSSTEKGTFYLEIDKKLLNKKVHISNLNYKDTIVFARDLQNKILLLESKNVELDEVVISKKRNRKNILGRVKGRVIPLYSGGVIKMIAKYFPVKMKEDLYFESITIHFSRRGSKKAKFRIRLFSVDETIGKPKDDLLLKSIPISIEKKQKKVFINLEEEFLEVPKNGFFVAFEKLYIPENKYIYKGYKNKKVPYYAPVIGLTKTKEHSLEDCKVYLFNKGKWWLSPKMDKEDRWVPAISVTLSN